MPAMFSDLLTKDNTLIKVLTSVDNIEEDVIIKSTYPKLSA